MSEKALIKDAKMLMLEEHFNDDIEDILWRLRQVDRKSMEEMARDLSFGHVSVSVDEIATWLAYLSIDELFPIEMLKPTQDKRVVPPRPKKKTDSKAFDPGKGSSVVCDDTCAMAAYCKYYERYFGKRCVVDLQSKNEFLTPILGFIKKTYDRDPELKTLYGNVAEQIASIYQIMKRKERYLNVKGITQIERKIDPSTGKMVENEVPNPLAGAILQDNKQIMAMLKEMGMTPKSLTSEDTGESDPASLSKALQLEEAKKQDEKHLTAIKQDRYKNRPQITSKEQLISLIQEKMQFDTAIKRISSDEDDVQEPVEAPQNKNAAQQDSDNKLMRDIPKPDKILNKDDNVSGHDSDKKRHDSGDVDIPDDVLAILHRIEQDGGKDDGQ
jgi:hypothetical protein